LFGSEQIPVDDLQVPTSWHASLALQTMGVPLLQTPPWHVSSSVQLSPSEQIEPSALAGLLHMPVAGSQVPAVWHGSMTLHVTGLPPTQTPDVHVSVWVQASPSEQADPSALCGFVQTPVDGLHAPASWHWSRAAQTVGAPPMQTPDWQVSPCVHLLPSSQAVPSATGVTAHAPVAGSQAAT
jgi:hypothetical protein